MPAQLVLIAVSWVAFLLYWSIAAIGVKQDLPQQGSWGSGHGLLLRLVAAAILILVLVLRRGQAFNRLGLLHRLQAAAPGMASGPVLGTIGALLCVLGIACALWARWHLGSNWSWRPALKADHALITSGPYRLVRHPIYSGLLLAVGGSTLAASWPLVIIPGMLLVVFVRRIHHEEQLLLQHFPERYPAYQRRTWALIPWLY